MRRSRPAAFVLITLALALCALPAAASSAAPRPPGSPDLAAMALAPEDLPASAEVDREGYYRDPDFVAAYVREFALGGKRVGRSRLVSVSHDLGVEATVEEASASHRALRRLLRSRSFRTRLAGELARESGTAISSLTVSRPRTARIGDGAVSIVVGLSIARRSFQVSLTFLRVDRVLGILALVGAPGRKVYAADANRVARLAAARTRTGLLPVAVAAPGVSGRLQPGQVLTPTRGTWSGDQLVFSYRWERCTDGASDQSCVALAGATAVTYTVVAGDLASPLRLTVTASNRLGTASASSALTAPITGPPGAPVATRAPALEAQLQPGALLTVDPGLWTGEPTEYAYLWRRCEASTMACVDIADAAGPTYTVAAADSGAVLRVLVVATNAAGPGGALTAPSAPVP